MIRRLALAGAALLLAGCGVQTKEAGRPAATSTTALPPAQGRPAPDRTVRLASTGRSFAGVRTMQTTEEQAVAALCAGRVDVAQASAPPTAAVRRACSNRGLALADPVALTPEAVVLAVRSRASVGGTCLTTRRARDLFRRGSPYEDWGQLGFSAVPIRAVGPEPGSEAFALLGRVLLGVEGATLADVRSDLVVRRSDAALRADVLSEEPRAAARRRARALAAGRRQETSRAREAYRARAIAVAGLRVDDYIRRHGGTRRANVSLRRRTLRDAARRAGALFDRRLAAEAAVTRGRLVRAATRRGVVGAFPFPAPGRLRPLGIGADCVRPTRESVRTGAYPLTRRPLLLTTRTALRRPEVRRFLAAAR